VVTYSNEAKIELLGVQPEWISTYGAVSEPVAQGMAEGIRDRAKVDVGVGITGVAGPTGGTPTKPVGMVCISVATEAVTAVRTFRFPGTRELVKTFAAFTALDMVRRTMLQTPPNVDWQEKIST
jgi:nicotinamide-nucleotide amidase